MSFNFNKILFYLSLSGSVLASQNSLALPLSTTYDLPSIDGLRRNYRLFVQPFLQESGVAQQWGILQKNGVFILPKISTILHDNPDAKRMFIDANHLVSLSQNGNEFYQFNPDHQSPSLKIYSSDTRGLLKKIPIVMPKECVFVNWIPVNPKVVLMVIGKPIHHMIDPKSFVSPRLYQINSKSGVMKEVPLDKLDPSEDSINFQKVLSESQVCISHHSSKGLFLYEWNLNTDDLKLKNHFLGVQGSLNFWFDQSLNPVFATSAHKANRGDFQMFQVSQNGLKEIYRIPSDQYKTKQFLNLDPQTGCLYIRKRGGEKPWTVCKIQFEDDGFGSLTSQGEKPIKLSETCNITHYFYGKDSKHPPIYGFWKEGCFQYGSDDLALQTAIKKFQTQFPGSLQMVSHSNPSETTARFILKHCPSDAPPSLVLVDLNEQENDYSYQSLSLQMGNYSRNLLNFQQNFKQIPVSIQDQKFPMDLLVTVPKHPNGHLIVIPHGGPQKRDRNEWNPLCQILASYGLHVLQVNFPGSTGVNLSYEEAIDGNWPKTSGYLKQAIDYVIQNYHLQQKITIIGGSFGATAAMQFSAVYPKQCALAIGLNGNYDFLQELKSALQGRIDSSPLSVLKSILGPNHPLLSNCPTRVEQISPELEKALQSQSVDPGKIQCPIILMSGNLDTRVDPNQSLSLFYEVPSAVYYDFQNVGHALENLKEINSSLHEQIALREIIRYLAQNGVIPDYQHYTPQEIQFIKGNELFVLPKRIELSPTNLSKFWESISKLMQNSNWSKGLKLKQPAFQINWPNYRDTRSDIQLLEVKPAKIVVSVLNGNNPPLVFDGDILPAVQDFLNPHKNRKNLIMYYNELLEIPENYKPGIIWILQNNTPECKKMTEAEKQLRQKMHLPQNKK
jgi:pimeloyl-ACP methyl ester carboxylesterase